MPSIKMLLTIAVVAVAAVILSRKFFPSIGV
jgi:hypothetical protein